MVPEGVIGSADKSVEDVEPVLGSLRRLEVRILFLELLFHDHVDQHVDYLPQLFEVLPETCNLSEEFLVVSRR